MIDELIDETINKRDFKDYKVVKKYNQKGSLLREILTNKVYKSDVSIKLECISLRSSIAVILNYQATGC